MSVFIIPHSGTYYGRFEFAVVKSGKQHLRLKVTVRDEQKQCIVYTTKDTWISGNKLALPAGDYCVRAELMIPRLDGSSIFLNAIEMHYSVRPGNPKGSAPRSLSSGNPLRDELMSLSGHIEELNQFPADVAASSVLSADDLKKHQSTAQFGVFTPLRGSVSEASYRSPSFTVDAKSDGAAKQRTPSRGIFNQEFRLKAESKPAQTLYAFSEQLSHRATPLSVGELQRVNDVSAQPSPQSPTQWTMRSQRRSSEPIAANDEVRSVLSAFNAPSEPAPTPVAPWIWSLSPTAEKEEKEQKEQNVPSPEPTHSSVTDERPSGVMKSHKPSLVTTPPKSSFEHNASSLKRCTPSPLFLEATTPWSNGASGACPLDVLSSKGPLRQSTQSAHLSCNPTPNDYSDNKTPVSTRNATSVVLSANRVHSEKEVLASSLTDMKPSRKSLSLHSDAASSKGCLIGERTTLSTLKLGEGRIDTTLSSSRKLASRSSIHLTSPHLPLGRESYSFLIPPPEVIDLHSPFSLVLAFGSPSVRPLSNSVFLNVLLEEEVEPGAKPTEPALCVVPAMLAVIPTRAKGVSGPWVCSPSVRANERSGVIELFCDALGKLQSGIAISSVCVGPSCDGLALSGLQFVLGNVRGARSCQFFVSFREIEDMNVEEEEEEGGQLCVQGNDGAGGTSVAEINRYMPSVDERALNAEIIYNSLPYIRCVVSENGEMVLEVHRKNVVVACSPAQEGSRISMYFGTTVPKNTSGGGGGGTEDNYPYISILLDYRTVYCYPIHSERVPEALRVIMMSNVEPSIGSSDVGASMQLREVELLSQQNRLVAFADEVIFDNMKDSQPSGDSQLPKERGQQASGKLGSLSVWVAGEGKGAGAQRRVTLA